VHFLLAMQALTFAVLAGAQVLATWHTDLVEPRRRLRLFLVAAAAGYTVVTALSGMVRGPGQPIAADGVEALVLLAIGMTVAWSLLQISGDAALFVSSPDDAHSTQTPARATHGEAFDQALIAALERAMVADRVYRQEGLTIGKLAQMQSVPEYKLRRTINQALGYRNFTAFLNYYRLADAKAGLTDPSQAEVPITTIALDAGFTSLGPFNRAFKADTGITPSEFRRCKLAAPREGTSGTAGKTPFPVRDGQISNPA